MTFAASNLDRFESEMTSDAERLGIVDNKKKK